MRGGNTNEVLTILDQASLYNPFIFDDDFNTSSYTTINPSGLRGINFSSSRIFPQSFGNVLSAVLDLKTYEMPQGSGGFLWLGLANVGLSGVYLNQKKDFGASINMAKPYLSRISG